MGQLIPFRALRYSSTRIQSLADVVTQPYDKITPDMRNRYLARHPFNIVRVIKNPDYQDARSNLKRWIDAGVLERDQVPAFYPYEQVFEFEGNRERRLGFISLVSLRDSSLAIKGHENILKEPLEDRLKLIRETESYEGLIFTLYSDPELGVDRILGQQTSACPPLASVDDEYGVSHRLWAITDPAVQQAINQSLANLSIYIADGHHRFQTSVLFCRECEEKGWRPAAAESFDKRLIALFNMRAPGLRILPTHRGIRNLSGFDPRGFLSTVAQFFDTTAVDSWTALKQALAAGSRHIGLILGDPPQFVVLRPNQAALTATEFLPGVESPARELNVNLLHEGILKPYLGIGPGELASQKYVDYFRDPDELLAGIRASRYQLGFILNPTTLDQVREVSEKGEKMPQKSTDFYPKLLTGLVIMKMEIDKSGAVVR
ncbi:MAG: DUF1015 domain-containing protein [Acidobacteria bacterium]|nr:MAG: DUF1015 domain-containing protein [Acidobacteriota bacterium]